MQPFSNLSVNFIGSFRWVFDNTLCRQSLKFFAISFFVCTFRILFSTQVQGSLAPKMSSSNVAKRHAARKAVDLFVRNPNMKIGLGSGSTVVFVAESLKKLSVDSASVATCVPTSYQSRELILSNRLPLCDLDQNEDCQLDVTIDGADEVIK